MAVAPRGKVFYTVYRLPGRKWHKWDQLKARSLSDARKEDRALRVERDRLRREGRLTDKLEMSWKDLVAKYLAFSEGNGNSPATLRRKTFHFQHIDEVMGIELVSGWTPVELEDFKLRARREGVAISVINKELVYIKAALALARRLKVQALSSEEAKDVKQVSGRPPEAAFFLADERAKLLSVAPPFWRVAILLGGLAGLRRAEALGLKWNEVSLPRRELCVLDRPDRRTKTRRSRTVPLHEALFDELVQWRQANKGDSMVLPWAKDGNEFSKAFRRLCKKAGLNGNYKALRHGFCTELTQLNVSALKVQSAAGHGSIKTTQKYMHLGSPDLRDDINKLRGPGEGESSKHSSKQPRNIEQFGATTANANTDGGTKS